MLRDSPYLRADGCRGWSALRVDHAFGRTATALLLVSAAGGRVDEEQLTAVLTAAGWSGRTGTGVHRYAGPSAAEHADDVLQLIDAYSDRRSVTPFGRVLAIAALRSR